MVAVISSDALDERRAWEWDVLDFDDDERVIVGVQYWEWELAHLYTWISPISHHASGHQDLIEQWNIWWKFSVGLDGVRLACKQWQESVWILRAAICKKIEEIVASIPAWPLCWSSPICAPPHPWSPATWWSMQAQAGSHLLGCWWTVCHAWAWRAPVHVCLGASASPVLKWDVILQQSPSYTDWTPDSWGTRKKRQTF